MKEVTLKQIAENLGISITTVSKALKDYPDVSAKTKARVKEEATKLNYKPNVFAVNLRTKESKTLGLIIPEVVHHFFSSVINGIIEQAEKKGYLVIILQSNENFELEKKQVELLISKRVDGIMISLASSTADISHINRIKELEIPLVMFDKISKLVDCSKIIIDDREAAYKATKHLIDQGCKRIAHFRGPLLPQNSIDRFLGYKKALEDHGITYDSSLVYICERVNYEDGRKAAQKLLDDHDDVDGIFTNTDLIAVGTIAVFNERGIKVPEQVSIMGFSNWFVSQAITPSLSTVDQPGYQMGKQTFKMLRKEIKAKKNKRRFTPTTVTLPTAVIKRNST
ncbi:LacI family DNA-binding transcriptional regulator [Altibacter sp. HG106]|uniref:LacI family DNA-binding transcriptional regulator n=1 Tax=Altibacter sp. HG106 TaxID=3023937 RepID=UPI00234FB9F7|nr:LacI family DNA-binding transcriptional regulator [Altibacter sp. HG106]MDC7994259.1 LacI family DNA-binding transcriptional regulator [Altibacter sp. HG106]